MELLTGFKKVLPKGKSIVAAMDDYVAIDLETTGLSPKSCQIIEIGAVRVVGGEPKEAFVTFVHPSFSIPSFITSLTGITNKHVEDAPDIAEVLPVLSDFIGDSVLLGHNVSFDVNFLVENYCRCGGTMLNDFIDTLRVARRVFKGLPNYRLGTIIAELGIPNEVSHRAADDCLAAHRIYERAKAQAKESGISIV